MDEPLSCQGRDISSWKFDLDPEDGHNQVSKSYYIIKSLKDIVEKRKQLISYVLRKTLLSNTFFPFSRE